MIKSIYREECHGWPWFKISKNTAFFFRFLEFKVSSGNRIKFWSDKWVGEQPLKHSFPALFSISTKQAWSRRRSSEMVPRQSRDLLHSFYLPTNGGVYPFDKILSSFGSLEIHFSKISEGVYVVPCTLKFEYS